MYAAPNMRIVKSRRMRWAGNVERMEAVRDTYKILVGKSEGKRPLGVSGRVVLELITGR
jgi:hypothetical protein